MNSDIKFKMNEGNEQWIMKYSTFTPSLGLNGVA